MALVVSFRAYFSGERVSSNNLGDSDVGQVRVQLARFKVRKEVNKGAGVSKVVLLKTHQV